MTTLSLPQYAVSCVAHFCANTTKDHWTAVKRILRYLKGTSNFGLLCRKEAPAELTGYSDADWQVKLETENQPQAYYQHYVLLDLSQQLLPVLKASLTA